MTLNQLVWHYTTGRCFKMIDADGVIKPASLYIRQGERPAAWFSRNQVWESTAKKALMSDNGAVRELTMAETAKMDGGLYRIGVLRTVACYGWDDYVRLSGISRDDAQGLK